MLLDTQFLQIKQLFKLYKEERFYTLDYIKNIKYLFTKYVVADEETRNLSVDQNSASSTIYDLLNVLNILSSRSNYVTKTTKIQAECEFNT